MSFKKTRSACLLIAGAIVGAVLFILPGCQGPAGPAGNDGQTIHIRDTIVVKDTIYAIDTAITPDTVRIILDTLVQIDTILMSPSCAVCHGNDQTIKSKEYQWAVSKHATGETFIGEGSNAGCIRCHNGAGFVFTLSKADSAAILASPSNVNCRTCHTIHTKYDSTDWKLTVSDTAHLPLIISPGTTVNFGKGNLCVTCHQTRSEPMKAIEAAAVNATGSSPYLSATNRDSVVFPPKAVRLSAHYGSQTEIFFAKGAWEPDSGVGRPNTDGVSPHVDEVKDGCVTCHLGVNHTFEPNVASCKPCHATATTFDVDTVQTKVAALSKELLDTLVVRGIAKIDPTSPIGYGFNGAGKTFPKAVVGAFVNLQMISWDGSKGVHNGPYTLYLLRESLKRVK